LFELNNRKPTIFLYFVTDKRVVCPIYFGNNIMPVLRDYAIITLGILTLFATSAAVYGILTINTQIQAKPEQVKVPDYTTELDSLKSQVDSINSQVNSINSQISTMSSHLAVFDTLKNNVADINAKLSDLATNYTSAQQTIPISSQYTSLAIVLDKVNYLQTDAIQVTVIGANPQKTVDIELLDSTGFVVLHKTIWSDSTGKVTYSMQLSSALPLGNYKIQVISDQQTTSQSLVIVASNTSTTTPNSGTFTAQTDKSIYVKGDLIKTSGTGQPNTLVSAVLTSPSGLTHTTTSTTNSDGTYTLFFSIDQSYETGNWIVTVSNISQSKTLSIYIQS
jgi:hypothetical protein